MKYMLAKHKKKGKVYTWQVSDELSAKLHRSGWALVDTVEGEKAVKIQQITKTLPKDAVMPTASCIAQIPVDDLHLYRPLAHKPFSYGEEKCRWEAAKLSIEPYWRQGYQVRQLIEIRKALTMGLKVPWADPSVPENKMRSLRRADMLQVGTAIGLIPKQISKRQRMEIIYGLESGVDILVYNTPTMDWRRMRDIRMALEAGVPADLISPDMGRKSINALTVKFQNNKQKNEIEIEEDDLEL